MKGERLRRFDALKFFAIFLVVWGHSIAWFSSREATDLVSFRLIYSFHMPLFMAIAGFFSARLREKPIKTVIKDRCLPLLVPTLTLGVAVSLFEWILSGASFIDSLALSFWFLISLALCTLLYIVTMQGRKYLVLKFFAGLFISQILPPLVRYDFNIGTMYPSFLLGVLLSWNFEYFKRHVKIIFTVSLACFLIMLYFQTPETFVVSFPKTHTVATILDFAFRYSYKLGMGICGAVASISFFEMMATVVPVSRAGDRICAMGRETLAIYVLSGVIVHTIVVRIVQFDSVNVYLYEFLLTPVIAYVTIEICIWLTRLIHKNKTLSFVLFGKR